MFKYLKSKYHATISYLGNSPQNEETENFDLTENLSENICEIRRIFDNSSDLLIREIEIGGVKIAFVLLEAMVDQEAMSKLILEPFLNNDFGDKPTSKKIFNFLQNQSVLSADIKNIFSTDELFQHIMSGFVAILIDGIANTTVFGIQGYKTRSVSEPSSETNEFGSHEGFVETVRTNMSMVRRRIKSPMLKFELFNIGNTSKTDICMVYMTNKVSKKLLDNTRTKIKNLNMDIILTSGYIVPFLEGKPWSFFSDVGKTERPDVLCGKIFEGRIGIIVDGTPYAIIIPYLFNENFQTIDDYSHRAYYATFIRIIKYLSFFISIFFPAIYIAIGTFHPQLFPQTLLFNIANAEATTPFSLMTEAIIIHFLYEIMREAGLRLPKGVGHTIGIVGGLVIGDAAVSAGFIGAPMILMVALTSIAAFVLPSLYPTISVLRLLFIFIGGFFGIYGVVLCGMLLLLNIAALNNMGMPYLAPVTPFSGSMLRDTIWRISFKKMNNSNVKIQKFEGAELNKFNEED